MNQLTSRKIDKKVTVPRFVDYRSDVLPLEETVELRMKNCGISKEDRAAVWGSFARLGRGRAARLRRDHDLRVGLLAGEIAAALDIDSRMLLLAGLRHDGTGAPSPCALFSGTRNFAGVDSMRLGQVSETLLLIADTFDALHWVGSATGRAPSSREIRKRLMFVWRTQVPIGALDHSSVTYTVSSLVPRLYKAGVLR
jgi:hypothetical protein